LTQSQSSSRLSVRELASRLGVSNATVSRALNNHPEVSPQTRARVLDLAQSTGYIGARGARPQTKTIGLVYPTDPVRPDHGSFETAMLSGVLSGINEQRFDVMWVNVERDKSPDETYSTFFRRKGLRGVIVRSVVPNSTMVEDIATENFPAILIADHSDNPDVSFVYSDSRADSTRAVDHLVHLGHTRIAIAMHAVLDADHHDRLDGYLEGLHRHGVERDDDLIATAIGTLDGGRQAIDRLLGLENPPTAIYFTTPPSTLGALQRCLELGIRVPDDLSIVGFDDSDMRFHAFPNYTAVCQDAAQMGLEAARWLTRAISGSVVGPLREVRPTTFSVQKSTGIAPVSPVRLTPTGLARDHAS